MRSLKSLIGSPLATCALFLTMTVIAAAQTPIQDDQKSVSKWAEDTVDLGLIKEVCGGYYFVETGAGGRTFDWYIDWGIDHFGNAVKEEFSNATARATGAIKAAGSPEARCLAAKENALRLSLPTLFWKPQ